jgi:putative transposase
MYKLDKTGNATFSLMYHFIAVVKYRKQIFINDEIISDLKTIIKQKADNFDVEIIEQECGIDHIHILFRTKPTLEMTKFINAIKGHSSRELRKKYKEFLSDKLWGDSFWSPSYFLATTGNVTIDILKQYVENQRSGSDGKE